MHNINCTNNMVTYNIILSLLKFIDIFSYRKNGLKYSQKRSRVI